MFDKYSNDPNMMRLVDFYQYKSANSDDSQLSLNIDSKLSASEKDELFSQMLSATYANTDDFIFAKPLHNEINRIRSIGLSDTTLCADRIKGMFSCSKETHKLDSCLHHIRDSFAHGRIAFLDNYIIMEDKAKVELTGRLVMTTKALFSWKDIILNYLQEKKYIAE